jgi:hypothetical protein
MRLISSATRFFANGHAGFAAACAFSAMTRASLPTSTTIPLTSLRAANVASLARSVPPPGMLSGSSSGSFPESTTMTVARPVFSAGERGTTPVSVTLVQVVGPLTIRSVNGCDVLNAPLRPVTRT